MLVRTFSVKLGSSRCTLFIWWKSVSPLIFVLAEYFFSYVVFEAVVWSCDFFADIVTLRRGYVGVVTDTGYFRYDFCDLVLSCCN